MTKCMEHRKKKAVVHISSALCSLFLLLFIPAEKVENDVLVPLMRSPKCDLFSADMVGVGVTAVPAAALSPRVQMSRVKDSHISHSIPVA